MNSKIFTIFGIFLTLNLVHPTNLGSACCTKDMDSSSSDRKSGLGTTSKTRDIGRGCQNGKFSPPYLGTTSKTKDIARRPEGDKCSIRKPQNDRNPNKRPQLGSTIYTKDIARRPQNDQGRRNNDKKTGGRCTDLMDLYDDYYYDYDYDEPRNGEDYQYSSSGLEDYNELFSRFAAGGLKGQSATNGMGKRNKVQGPCSCVGSKRRRKQKGKFADDTYENTSEWNGKNGKKNKLKKKRRRRSFIN